MTKDQLAKYYTESGAAKERARIRRLIGPALRNVVAHLETIPCQHCEEDCAAIDAATKPESKRKRGAK